MKRIFPWLTVVVALLLPFDEVSGKELQFASVLDLSLAELMQVQVVEVGSLTATRRARVPAAVTRLTQNDIQELGARSLLELLEIAVPSLQVIRHHYELDHIGVRGVTSDREDKVMIRVNGRVMNERTARGAITERDFPLMRDIKQIEIIRGAGSALYGLGAMSVVIDITTFDAGSLKENSVGVRGGAGMPYYALDGNYRTRLENGLGVYLHAELADIQGANDNDAPQVFGAEAVSIYTGETIPRGSAFPTKSRDGEGFKGRPFVKAHLGLDHEDTKFWLRYTKAGRKSTTILQRLAEPPVGRDLDEEPYLQLGYEQLTATLEQKHQLSNDIAIEWMLSFDRTDIFKQDPFENRPLNKYGEDEYFGRLVANWSASASSDVALGAESSYERFGVRDSQNDPWNAQTYSLLGEWQWRPHPDVTTFVGGRLEKNSYTDLMYSPRFSIVYSSDNLNTYKLLLTQSQRMNIAAANRRAELEGNKTSDPELLKSVELRYERAEERRLIALSAYYIDLDAIGWDQANRRTAKLGAQRQWGFEAELEEKFASHRIRFSYAYCKLLDFDLYGGATFITAEPYGYGDDLADWATHATKLWYRYQMNERTSFTSTLRAFWGYDGSRDFRDKRLDDGTAIVTPGWEKGYREQVYLNLGLRHKPSDQVTLSVDLHNLLGLFDKDFNKRAYRDSLGDYRSEAVAISVGLVANF